MRLKVNEIFYSIQGESTFAGCPTVFIRLTGCNLRCNYCDTEYAFIDGVNKTIGQIVTKVKSYGCDLVEVTGGEPLIQKNTPLLIKKLLDVGFTVLLETNGSKNIDIIDKRCIRIVDIKCPSSGEDVNNDLANLTKLQKNDEIKFVIGSREDFDFAKKTIKIISKNRIEVKSISFSPIYGKIKPDILAEWILKNNLKVRLNLQIHKYIWHPDKRGV